jgi:adenylate cyclase
MQVKLTEGEQARLRYTTTTNVAAWTHWVQGLSHYRQSLTRENAGAARACWEKALALDPGSATLNAMLGFIHVLDARFGWWDDRDAAAAKARIHVDRALKLDPDNADAHIASGGLCWLQRRFDDAIADAKRAVELAPGSADVVELAGFFLTMAGSPREALELIKKAGALNPNYPPMYLGSLGHAHRLAGQVEEAIIAFKAYDARVPGAGFGLTDLVVLYQEAGRLDEAKETAARLLAARPQFTIGSWLKTQIIRDMARSAADAAALRAAGLPEG